MLKKMLFLFILGFAPGVGFIAWSLFSDRTPMADEFTRKNYLEGFVKYKCKLNPDDFFAGRIDKDKDKQCNDLYYSKMEDLLIEGYGLSDKDQKRVIKLCEIENCRSLKQIEKTVRQYRQSQKDKGE